MKTGLATAFAAVLIGSAGVAAAAPASAYAPCDDRTAIHGTWAADTSVATRPIACDGYGYAYGSNTLCETATGGPVGGIN